MGASIDAPSATTEDTTEDEVEDAGTIAAPTRSGTTGLVRTVGRTSLVRAHGGTSLTRTALRAMLVSLHCRHHQGGTTTTSQMRGLGASRNHAPSPASWVELRP